MGKLIMLELHKIKLRNWLICAIIANLLISLWVSTNLPDEAVKSYLEAFYSIRSYVEITFIVFSSVLLSKLFLDEYKNRTISVLFTYPVPRHHILIAKLILFCLFSFLTALLSNGFVAAFFLFVDSQRSFIAEPLTLLMLREEFFRIVINSISVVGLGIIPLYIGLIRKSVPAFMVCSMFLALMFGSTHDESGNNWSAAISIAMFCLVLGMISAIVSIRKVIREDIM
ncbi:ABC transporter permease [Paenibacillus sp. LHD-38]|uniref:ABC transporter permease n=1 Tax=Paenibacillus sp. LHD-38 TaxID=3072143 RepID=UPI00280CF587|nr:ABC transporter permease [Paenibacillus sp. LHD-38]MDQ8733678.1 ABC transporter permease [Paenibacillus sp. LHD-38]